MKKQILTKNQVKILEEISKDNFIKNNFYLTGGTCLANFYLQHRLSEDLDFFTEIEFEPNIINIFLKKIKAKLKIKKFDFQQSYNRNIYFLHFENEIIKTEFTYYPFTRIDKTKKVSGIQIDSLIDMGVNKLFTIYQRSQARDYIDLYFICKEKNLSISSLIKKAHNKFDYNIDLLQLGTQFFKATTVKDFPKMLKKINHKLWQDFFIKEAEQLKKKIVR